MSGFFGGGKSNARGVLKEVAAVLNLTTRTVAFHKYRIMEVLNIRTNAELVQYAIRTHVIAA